jgi:protocatechuate 3,4-dioxygenase beta subunit
MTDNSNWIKMSRRQVVNTLLFTTGLLAATKVTKVLGQTADTSISNILPEDKACVLTPQAVEGPYYLDPKLVRTDITEGKEGVPLKLLLQVIDTSGCTPLAGARVDVWHSDGVGAYSGYEGQADDQATSTTNQTFLRGTQITDTLGQVTFTTIYPGWYRGRTPHIHLKVFLDEQNVLTGQLYFPDALSEYIYQNVSPYNTRTAERDTVNTTDSVLRGSGGGHESFVNIKEEADYYLASVVLGVDRNATPTAQTGPGNGSELGGSGTGQSNPPPPPSNMGQPSK